MWRDDAQRAAVARALLALVRFEDLWDEDGPTEAAVEYLEAGGGPLSSEQAVFLRLAFDVWNGDGGLIDPLLSSVDPERLLVVAGFLEAYATEQVDGWLAERGAR